MAETKEIIKDRMLSNISNEYDKSEGSFFYDVITPVAAELEKLGVQADEILDTCFASTAKEKYLDLIVDEVGLERKQATRASGVVKITGVVGAKINKNEMVASDNCNYIFTDNNTIPAEGFINVMVECVEYGVIGNIPVGAIKYFPKTLEGLQSVSNETAFTNGYDKETDESLRNRYYTKVQTPATSGNIHHYRNWCLEVIGVGDCKVFPLWAGNGTVKCTIIDSNKRAASVELIDKTKTYIEENRPIGATITVISAVEKTIDINVDLVIDDSFTIDEIKNTISEQVTELLKASAFKIDYISISKIGALILNTTGVLDYSNLKLNNATGNISIADEEIAILGELIVNV